MPKLEGDVGEGYIDGQVERCKEHAERSRNQPKPLVLCADGGFFA